MSDFIYDVAIVGGGMAGLSLAIQCRAAGHSVVLFEKEQYPFHKVCGEYISLESWNFLEALGLDLHKMNLPFINNLKLSDLGGKIVEVELPLGGFGVSRFKIDQLLYQLALKNGVVFYTNTKVTDIDFANNKFKIVSSTSNIIEARVAAGCYGRKGNLDVKWKRNFTFRKPGKLNNYVGVKYHITYPVPENVIALHNFKNGYCGISRIEDGKSCLCYLTSADNLKNADNSINKMEKEILAKNPFLNEIFAGADFIFNEPLVVSQVSFERKTQIENHVLMLGDTAGVIAPLSGNGMSMALHSSKIAYGQINAFLTGEVNRDKMEQSYLKLWNLNFKKRLVVGRVLQMLAGKEKQTAFFVYLMKTFPFVLKKLIKSTHGKSF